LNRKAIYNLAASAVCLALCMVLPFLTGQIPEIGQRLAPMHIPVLLCGFLCGAQHGAIVGLTAPLLRFLVFGSPPLVPIGVAMCFELAVYGIAAGLLYAALPKKPVHIYISLVTAMLAGRAVFGAVTWRLLGGAYSWEAFVSAAFVNAVPGIIVHIAIIPVIVLALKRRGAANGA
jgi:thiamine transporter ThiT